MIKLIGTFEIPEWAICYLVNGDSEGLSDEELQAANEFQDSILKKYDADYITFDTEVMDEEKYGNFYYDTINAYPAFGRKFGACATWNLPVWVNIPNDNSTKLQYSFLVHGEIPWGGYQTLVFENKSFIDDDEAEEWVDAYFKHLRNMEYIMKPAEDFSFKHSNDSIATKKI